MCLCLTLNKRIRFFYQPVEDHLQLILLPTKEVLQKGEMFDFLVKIGFQSFLKRKIF